MTKKEAFEIFLGLVADAENDLQMIKKLQIEYDYIFPYLIDNNLYEYSMFSF